MRRAVLYLVIAVVMVGCGKTHPVKLEIDPAMESGSVEKIAVFPFSSALHQTADPDGAAPRTFDQLFRQALDTREDYQWVAPSSVSYVLEGEGMEADAETFVDNWRKKRQADPAFLKKLGDALQVDGVMIGVVELWQQDEVDVRETATPTTYVGATVTIFDVNDGKVLFEASDEAREYFGETFVRHFVTSRRWEASEFAASPEAKPNPGNDRNVTTWELRRYFELV